MKHLFTILILSILFLSSAVFTSAFAQNSSKSRIDMYKNPKPIPAYIKKNRIDKYELVLNEEQLRAVDGLKEYTIDELNSVIEKLQQQRGCIIGHKSCVDYDESYANARVSQLSKANRIYRRLIGMYSFISMEPHFLRIREKVHFIPKLGIESIQTKPIRLMPLEITYITSVHRKIYEQIENEWEEKKARFDNYLNNNLLPQRHRKKLDQPIEYVPSLKLYRARIISNIKQFYLYQITKLVGNEPILIYMHSFKANKDTVNRAYYNFIQFIMSRQQKISGFTKHEDISSLVNMYISQPQDKQSLELASGILFTNQEVWDSLIKEIHRVSTNKSKFSLYMLTSMFTVVTAPLLVPALAIPLYGTFVAIGWLAFTYYEFKKAKKEYEHDISFWTSGHLPYSQTTESFSKVYSSQMMMVFFGIGLHSTFTKLFSSNKQLFTLQVAEANNFINNLNAYLKARANRASQQHMSDNFPESSLFEVYLTVDGNNNIYIPAVLLDYNDIKVWFSGCLMEKTYSCKAGN